jgi:phage terminase large subunit
MNLNFKVTNVFKRNLEAFNDPNIKIIVNQGGTRSSKTYSITQLLIIDAIQRQTHISICSETMPHLKRGALADFLEIMAGLEILDQNAYNKTDFIYKLLNSKIEFFSVENDDKVRGSKRETLFVNECNLVSRDTFFQLLMRTSGKVFIDYNPSDEHHWIYDNILERDDCRFIQSTYKDNPHLPKHQIKEIEKLIEVDENYWQVFGLGNIAGINELTIYKKYNVLNQFGIREHDYNVFYGLDFGFTVPTALVKCMVKEKKLYVREMIYESGLTSPELIKRMKKLNIPRSATIWADNADPGRITDLQIAGYNCRPCKKSRVTGKAIHGNGILFVKTFDLNVHKIDLNLIKEIRCYKWKNNPKTGEIFKDEPVKLFDHALDAIRYAVFSELYRPVITEIISIPIGGL